ncbi:MAG: urease accessory protein UreD [Candidatus Acidiferrum sp.]
MTATVKAALPKIEPKVPGPNRVCASMRLDFARDPETGNTFLAASFQEPPLKVVRAFTLEDGTALAHLHNVSGGLLGGDQLALRINLACRTNVQLTTTGATRIYRHRAEFSPATQCNDAVVGEGALLEYLPDAIIPFAGAHFLQHTSIDLADGAGMFWWEILAPGREARGERFEYKQFEMRTRVTALGRKIAAENICLRPDTRDVSSLARLGPYRYTATFYICRVGPDASAWRASEDRLREVTIRLTRPGETLWGVSFLVAHGLVVRCLALNGRDVLSGLHAVWREAKFHLYGRDAIPPRKVN